MKSAFSKSAKDPAIKESKDAKKKEDKAVMKDKVGFWWNNRSIQGAMI